MNRNDEQKMQFILSIRSKGVVDENVLNALETVNRQYFLKVYLPKEHTKTLHFQ